MGKTPRPTEVLSTSLVRQFVEAEFIEGATPDRVKDAAPELLEALTAAWKHLEYCGYGDKWERECALTEGLPEKVESALRKANPDFDKEG